MFFEEIDNKDGQTIVTNLVDTLPQTAANYGAFFTAIYPCEVMAVSERHGTAAGAAATLQVEKLVSGTIKGSGTNILTAAFDLQSTINTPVIKTATAFVLNTFQLKIGDSLALKSSGTIAAVKDLQVTVVIKRLGKGDYRL
jgi:hypothetical protein